MGVSFLCFDSKISTGTFIFREFISKISTFIFREYFFQFLFDDSKDITCIRQVRN